jgi:hypothetical protein
MLLAMTALPERHRGSPSYMCYDLRGSHGHHNVIVGSAIMQSYRSNEVPFELWGVEFVLQLCFCTEPERRRSENQRKPNTNSAATPTAGVESGPSVQHLNGNSFDFGKLKAPSAKTHVGMLVVLYVHGATSQLKATCRAHSR